MAVTIPERMGYASQPRCGTSSATWAATVRGTLQSGRQWTRLGMIIETLMRRYGAWLRHKTSNTENLEQQWPPRRGSRAHHTVK